MDDDQRMTIAKAYVNASNAHDVDHIATMLSPDVAYRSSGVGAHDGVEKILAMAGPFSAIIPTSIGILITGAKSRMAASSSISPSPRAARATTASSGFSPMTWD